MNQRRRLAIFEFTSGSGELDPRSPNGPFHPLLWPVRPSCIRDKMGHMTATQRLGSIKYLLLRANLRPVCWLWVNRSSTVSQRAASAVRVPIELTHNPVFHATTTPLQDRRSAALFFRIADTPPRNVPGGFLVHRGSLCPSDRQNTGSRSTSAAKLHEVDILA